MSNSTAPKLQAMSDAERAGYAGRIAVMELDSLFNSYEIAVSRYDAADPLSLAELWQAEVMGLIRAEIAGRIAAPAPVADEDQAAAFTDEVQAACEVARAALDHWEHFSDNAEFIAEVGGQELYDLGYSLRAQCFFTLNVSSSSPAALRAAIRVSRDL